MTIRHAVIGDIPRIVEMGQHFLHATAYHALLANSPSKMAEMATLLITSIDGLLLVADDAAGAIVGMIGMLIFEHHLSGERIAGEVIWWVEPETRGTTVGVQLLRQAETWAKAQQVMRAQMIAPNTRVGKMYERFGYTAIEVAYQRTLV